MLTFFTSFASVFVVVNRIIFHCYRPLALSLLENKPKTPAVIWDNSRPVEDSFTVLVIVCESVGGVCAMCEFVQHAVKLFCFFSDWNCIHSFWHCCLLED